MTDHQPQHTSPPSLSSSQSAVAGSGDEAGSDDVMKILADVEGQLNRLKSAQRTQDDALSALSLRSKALHQAEDTLQRTRQDLSHQQHNLQREQGDLQQQREQFDAGCRQREGQFTQQKQAIEEQRHQVEQQRSSFGSQQQELAGKQQALDQARGAFEQRKQQQESQFAAKQAELHAEATDLAKREREMNAERERVSALEKQCRVDQEEMLQKTRELKSERSEMQGRVEQAERNVGTLIQEMEQTQLKLAGKGKELVDAAKEITSLRDRQRDLEKAVHEATAQADEVEKETAELARMAEGERADLTGRLNTAQAQLQAVATARDVAQKELETSRQQAVKIEKELERVRGQLEVREKEFTDARRKLELASRKLAEFAQVLSEQTPQLEKGAAALGMVEQQQEQIEELTKQLAEIKISSDPEEMQRRDERIEQLTEALRQARGQSAGQAGIAEMEQANANLSAEVNRLKLELENAQLAADGAKRQLQDQVESAGSQAVKDASVAEHAAKLASLTAEIERLQSSSESDLRTQVNSRTRQLRAELEESQAIGQQRTEALNQRVAELERDLLEAQEAATQPTSAATSAPVPGPSEMSVSSKVNAQRIGEVVEHLRRRRKRLTQLRQWIRQKAVAASASGHANSNEAVQNEHLAKLQQEQISLRETRSALANAEKDMVRRWARPKAVFTVACVMFLAMVCAAAGWMIADQMAPAMVSASVVIEAKNDSRTALTPEQAEGWQAWHVAMLRDDEFTQQLAKRMAERRMDTYADAAVLSQRLQRDMTVDASANARLIVSLAGTDREEILQLLDILTAALTAESSRQMANRSDQAWAVAAHERKEAGRVRYASLNAVAIHDERIMYALPIFGTLFLCSLVLIVVAYARLSKAKRVFDQDAGVMFEEHRG